ncbi:hypothetical protein ACFSQ3_08345 [Sphingobacterium corticis]|uniref:DNA-binding transcriptional activator n=1 Tax=Sphingobacterium corticis TaxID=1812823 RepID=A0ABW5NJ56_9SPHI
MMNIISRLKQLAIPICVIISMNSFNTWAQGIAFTGSNSPIEQRSSLQLFQDSKHAFNGKLTIDFDLDLIDNRTAGYIIRIKDRGSDPTYNLYFDKEDDEGVFRLNEEGKSCLIRLSVPMEKLKANRWLSTRIEYDLHQGVLSLTLGKLNKKAVRAKKRTHYDPILIFGKSDYLIDVPTFSIRSLVVKDQKKTYRFPMLESDGNQLHDEHGESLGYLTKGTWLLNNAYHWQRHRVQYSSKKAGSDYDAKHQIAYYFNSDSLYAHYLRDNTHRSFKFTAPCPVLIKLGNSFVDTASNRLYVYETFYEHPYDGPTIASLDLSDLTWRVENDSYKEMEINHHGVQYIANKKSLFVFGGFGNMLYNNKMMQLPIDGSSWTAPKELTGDKILPRYFTSMGYSAKNKKIYLFGGMGNESGEHIVGRTYFYDLYEIDPADGTAKKIWQLNAPEKHFVPAKGLAIPNDDWLYALTYPEHVSHSLIQLKRFSLRDGYSENLGDSIPIYSDKISTRARLYYDEYLQKMVALVQESDDDVRSKLSIYELEFPAIHQAQLGAFPEKSQKIKWIVLAGLLVSGAIAGAVLVRRKTGSPKLEVETNINQTSRNEIVEITHKRPDRNAIFLFGDFTVLDRRGTDISHLFSTRLRQVFCLILLHSDGAGISSNLLSHLIWPDKEKDKVKTSRNVAINNLRKSLSDLDDIEIVYENGQYKLIMAENCYCDHQNLIKHLSAQHKLEIDRLALILRRGSFLLGMDDPMFDDAKAKLEQTLISRLQNAIEANEKQHHWENIYSLAKLMMLADPTNEEALFKGLNALTKLNQNEKTQRRFYEQFEKQHMDAFGEAYNRSLDDILKTFKS